MRILLLTHAFNSLTQRLGAELQALGHEIKRYQNEVRVHEDKELDLMEELDAAKKVLATAQAKLAETQKNVDEDLAQLAVRATNLEKRVAETKAERTTLAAPIDSGVLELYDRLLKSKGGTAIVPLENGICGGCHMKVVHSTLQNLQQAEAITQCEHCGRIVYLVE